jgi:hypothetical protein
VAVDYLQSFRLYLVWQFQNYGTNNYYSLAYTKWQVNFWGTSQNGPPIDTIKWEHGVTSDGSNSFTRSNENPGQTNWGAATIAKGNLKWADPPVLP